MTTASPRIPVRVLSGRNHKTVTATPTIDAANDYSDGDVLGTKMTLSGVARESEGAGAFVWGHAYSLVDIGASIPIRVILFNADPVNTTFTDNSALAIDSEDLDKIIGVINLDQRVDLGTPVMLHVDQPMRIPFVLPSGDDVYAIAVAGGTINFATAADLTFVFGIEQD